MTVQPITLAALPYASAQQIFDQVGRHLLTQKERAQFADNCRYRLELEDGRVLSCAAGCLIGDEEYREDIEDTPWSDLVKEAGFPSNHRTMITHLQTVHDTVDPINWARQLRTWAAIWGLDSSIVDEMEQA